MAVSNTSRHLKPLRLHELLAGRAAWTDELWDEVLEYLLGRVGSDDAIYMALLLKAMTGHTSPESPHKIDYLRRFRDHPPALLLGIFDVARIDMDR
jgi:hypothetical protein